MELLFSQFARYDGGAAERAGDAIPALSTKLSAHHKQDISIMSDHPSKVNGFAKLYDEIARRRDLSPGARILFTIILSLARTSGRCYASNGGLAYRAGLSRTQVKGLLLKLERAGLIEKQPDEHSQRASIQVLWEAPDPVKKVDRLPCQESGQGDPVKKVDNPPVKKVDRTLSRKLTTTEQTSQQKRSASKDAKIASSKQIRGGGSPECLEGTAPAPGTEEKQQIPPQARKVFKFSDLQASIGLGMARKPGAGSGSGMRRLLSNLPALDEASDDPIVQAELARRKPPPDAGTANSEVRA